MILPCQKHLFDIPSDVAYFNNAYISPLMHGVVEAMQDGIRSKAQPWTISPKDFFSYAEEARGLAAQIYGSENDSIAIVPSASYGIQTAANILPLEKVRRY